MDRYILSQKTKEDIDSIYQFGSEKFGQDQALNYLFGLKSHFELLLENSDIGKQRNEIKEGLYSFPYGSYIIFYRAFQNHFRIVRVLHGSRDLRKFLR